MELEFDNYAQKKKSKKMRIEIDYAKKKNKTISCGRSSDRQSGW